MNSCNEQIWLKHLSFCESALNSSISTSTGKAHFELVYWENMIPLLDYPTGAILYSHVQAAGNMAEEVDGLVSVMRQALGEF